MVSDDNHPLFAAKTLGGLGWGTARYGTVERRCFDIQYALNRGDFAGHRSSR